jgi:hypothetical protein
MSKPHYACGYSQPVAGAESKEKYFHVTLEACLASFRVRLQLILVVSRHLAT